MESLPCLVALVFLAATLPIFGFNARPARGGPEPAASSTASTVVKVGRLFDGTGDAIPHGPGRS